MENRPRTLDGSGIQKKQLSRTLTAGPGVFNEMDSEIVPASLAVIAPVLRVANEIEDERPRVAYLCRFHAFEKAHAMDPSSAGRGVRQFKTSLLNKLEEDDKQTLKHRVAKSDAREIQNYYEEYYTKYVKSLHETTGANLDRAYLAKTYQTAAILFDVLKKINRSQLDPQTMEKGKEVEAKTEILVAYNILPLDPASASESIMMLPEIKAVITALRNVRGLSHFQPKPKATEYDLFDWLQNTFGFQGDNVANQREHLILLLANTHVRQSPKPDPLNKLSDAALSEVMDKLFKNYKRWCRFLHRADNLRLPSIQQDIQQRKILYIGLYLLIWGEAANLRFMPECLCYIFHQMAGDLHEMLSGDVSAVTGENVKPNYRGDPEDKYSFLQKVVTPIYDLIVEEFNSDEARRGSHSTWRNYDDLNEYFWSIDCFRLNWPMKEKGSFFYTKSNKSRMTTQGNNSENDSSNSKGKANFVEARSLWHIFSSFSRIWSFILLPLQSNTSDRDSSNWMGKTNFVEARSFWHIFRSFDRMWSFLILALQVMIIIAWNGTESTVFILDGSVFKKVLSIFITSAILRLIQAVVDIVLSFKAWKSMEYHNILRYILKMLVALAWVIALPICYAHSLGDSNGLASILQSWVGQSQSPSLYVTAVLVYLLPDAVSALLFLFPMLRRVIEQSELAIVKVLLWWAQPQIYVGRGMHESPEILFKYTLFWVLLFTCKLFFSYYLEIKPLVEPTKHIMNVPATAGPFPNEQHNFGVVLLLWAPIIMVYFMDAQIWYAIWSTVFGGINGAFSRLGEIRTLEMLKSRFRSLPGAFNANLVSLNTDEKPYQQRWYFSLQKSYKPLDEPYKNLQKTRIDTAVDESYDSHLVNKDDTGIGDAELQVSIFSQLWNEIIRSLWQEDYINSSEMELLSIPYPSYQQIKYIQWPPFLLANKVSSVIDMIDGYSDRVINDEEIFRRINYDPYMRYAVIESYDLLMDVLRCIMVGERERRIVDQVAEDVQKSIEEGSFFKIFKVTGLVSLFRKIVDVVNILENADTNQVEQLTFLLQDLLEVYNGDVKNDTDQGLPGNSEIPNEFREEDGSRDSEGLLKQSDQTWIKQHTFEFQKGSIMYPLQEEEIRKIRRLYLLLTTDESSMDVPSNLEARRRITFFANSLFMQMPSPPRVEDMLSFSILTPYNGEDIIFTPKVLGIDNDDGISVLYYLKMIYPDEWKNFLKRQNKGETEVENSLKFASGSSEEIVNEVCKWASYRAQTLTRTVRGMMYYRKALEIHAFFDMAKRQEKLEGYDAVQAKAENKQTEDKQACQLFAKIQAIADMKFTYVVSCQEDEFHRRTGESRNNDFVNLLKEYPCLRVAYVEEVEAENKKKEYFSALVKVANDVEDYQVIYRIKLPGPPILGEGKAENQNHAIIFTRGDALQAIDMNQDSYLEEAFKIRNFLEEFRRDYGTGTPSILGMSEHIFSGSVSSLAGFMSRQESTFVTLGQRVLANPLKVRFHYGHPDAFDRLFHLSRGGISKGSPIINLSEHVFAGYNTVLRRGSVTHHEYVQVGKGRDMGLNQISLAEARIATGNGEQTMSRDIYRLGHRVDFFRMFSLYYTTIGPYVNALIAILVVYIFLYGRIYLALSGLEVEIESARLQDNSSLEVAMASQFLVQIGFLVSLPMVMEIGLQEGFRKSLSEFITMQLQLASVFFTFMMGTKVHYYGQTLLHGGGKYKLSKVVQPKRSFIVFHAKFAENYRLYSRSHFTKGLELLMLLIVYDAYGSSAKKTAAFILITFLLWFLVGTWLFAPFLFNPSGFEWQKIVEDWEDWSKWVNNRGGIGVPADKSWETWWEDEQKHLQKSGVPGRVIEVLLAGRFLLYQYGLVYHLHIANSSQGVWVYAVSWLVLVFVLGLLKAVSVGSKSFSTQNQLLFRTFKGGIFFVLLTILIVLFVVGNLTFVDLFVSVLAFLPSGWALVQIAQQCGSFVKSIGMWDSVKALARGYESLMGVILFTPVAILAWFPFISDFQARLLFNQALSRGLQISRILAGRKVKKVN